VVLAVVATVTEAVAAPAAMDPSGKTVDAFPVNDSQLMPLIRRWAMAGLSRWIDTKPGGVQDDVIMRARFLAVFLLAT
jgi:hypothetical protein